MLTRIHTHTHTYTYVNQSRVKTDLTQRSWGCVCMYVYVEQCKNDKVYCSVSGIFSVSAGRGVKRRCSE